MQRNEDTIIAVVGMACRLPGANTPDEYWENLRSGRCAVRRYSTDELRLAHVPEHDITDPLYVPMGAPVDSFSKFDADFFALGPQDASIMDPQHRLLLECAWEALERSTHTPDQFEGAIGVYAGCGTNSYYVPKRTEQLCAR